jgi:hypothetical protein
MNLRRTFLAASAAALFTGLFAAPASAQVVEMLARLDGLQETPPSPSAGVGIGVFSVDSSSGVVDYRITFTGLLSPENAAHVHGFAPPGTPAGILFALPLGATKCGTFTLAPTQIADFLAGLAYVNIHTNAFGGGEIRGQISELESQPTYCYGDWTGVECPCFNVSVIGNKEGCLHSGGIGARLVAYGNPSLANDTVELHYLRGPATSPVLLFQGTTMIQAGSQFGDGLRCTAGTVVRLAQRTPCGGQLALPEAGEPRLSVLGLVTATGPQHYQGWYRNAASFCTASTFNLTNGVRVVWAP